MATVWIVNDGRSINFRNIDLTDARAFGQIKMIGNSFVFPDQVGPGDTMQPEILEPLRAAVEEFNPETDYLLPIGDIVQVVQLAVLLVQRYNAPIRTLRWDKQASTYYVVAV